MIYNQLSLSISLVNFRHLLLPATNKSMWALKLKISVVRS